MSYAPIRFDPTANHRTQYHNRATHFPQRNHRSGSASGRAIGATEKASGPDHGDDWPIIVHCHLCWDWVWQRPQQFISRLSERHPVLFIEMLAPDGALAEPQVRLRTPADFPNITLLSLQFPASRWENERYVDNERRRLVQETLAGPLSGRFDRAVQWFYDPMAVTSFLGEMGECLTVYDCMDELSKFKGAPPNIKQREARLLMRADVVFTGGRKLYEAKSRFHGNCHFYGCGVDWQHFGTARDPAAKMASQLETVRKPLLGYFGVIDERLDYELISRLAESNPEWSVAMVGPVMKVAPDSLPQRPNIHWLGQQAYADLPAFCKGFDVCLMPFALNESTEYINPTKALEYMATGRPIVGTPVADVVRNFGSVVKIAGSHDEFSSLCRQALDRPEPATIECGLQMARENSWESIVARLEGHVNEALAKKRAAKATA